MSDYQGQDPGATQVLPTAPPAAPPASPGGAPGAPGGLPPKRGVPWWAVVLVALLVALVAVGGTWAVMGRSGTPLDAGDADELARENEQLEKDIEELESKIESLSAGGTATGQQGSDTPESENDPPAGPTQPVTEKQFAYVKSGTWEGGTAKLTVDYAQFLSGADAAAAAAAHGDESPPPNDYYIVNDNPKLRTFPVKTGISVKVYNWGSGDASAAANISFGQWFDVMPGGTNPQPEWTRAPYWITITGGEIVKIEQQYLP